MQRRKLIAAAAAMPFAARAHGPFGRVEPPRAAPAMPLLGTDGKFCGLRERLLGRVTALQLMFTGCSAVCPLQGALFAAVAQELKPGDGRLLSLSIDPLGDDPKALSVWLARFGALPAWQAAVPRVKDVDRLLDLLSGRAEAPDRHSTQVYMFDRQARLVYRTPDLPPPAHVVELLKAL
jgi:protein SCO1/2